ncbi:MAG: undecaprenyl-diphosphatase UppP [Actinomycetota bacterium]|nr:undecaprenyl-diphosphatase UppP [Actinomycetota bacterium]
MSHVLRAIFLGVVQGLTEFVPVSSSGHLILIPKILGWEDQGLFFDVSVHIGTLLAIILFFRSEWIRVIRGFISSIKKKPRSWEREERLAWFIIVATIPAAFAGALLEGFLSSHMRNPVSVAWCLGAVGLVMFFTEFLKGEKRAFSSIKMRDSLSIGFCQVLSLLPGLSRSGITISAGMVSGLEREAAAKFSFMMAAPITAGAGFFEVVKIVGRGIPLSQALVMLTGFSASAITGFFTIRFLLRYLSSRSLIPFSIYCLSVSTGILLLFALT